jgi:dTDP-4-amino-4,6-dideoxygalactose transaminase
MPLYKNKREKLINTEKIAKSILTLPISASMTMDDCDYVINKFKKIFTASIK